MSFLFITNILKLITVTKPAAALMWINVYGMYTTGEVATMITEVPLYISDVEPLWMSSVIIHGVLILTLSASPCGPMLPVLWGPLVPLICERLYATVYY
jgi:hypothetical protein